MEIKRDRYLNLLISKQHNGLIKVITGMRRCGKSYLLFNLFKNYLLSEGIEESHIMENIIFNEKGNSIRKQLKIDFVCNKGSKRYYIQSAYAIPDQAKMGSLMLTGDFKRIIITKDAPASHYNENGVMIMSIYDFLLNENSPDI